MDRSTINLDDSIWVDEQADVSPFSQIKQPRGTVLRQIERDIGMSRLVWTPEAPAVAARDGDGPEGRDCKHCARNAYIKASQLFDWIERLKPQFVEVRFLGRGIVGRLNAVDNCALQIKGSAHVLPPKTSQVAVGPIAGEIALLLRFGRVCRRQLCQTDDIQVAADLNLSH